MTHTAAATGTPFLGPPCTGEAMAAENGAEELQQELSALLTEPCKFDWFGLGVDGGYGVGAIGEHVEQAKEGKPSASGDVRARTAYTTPLADITATCAQSFC